MTQAEALAHFTAADMTVRPISDASHLAEHAYIASRGVLASYPDSETGPLPMHHVLPGLSATPGAILSPAPAPGEHTRALLAKLDYGRVRRGCYRSGGHNMMALNIPQPARRLPPARAMVTAAQPEAADAGLVTLRAGGNAVDGAVAAALVQGVVDPLMSGLGGYGVLHAYDPHTKATLLLDGQGGCPAACTETMWADRIVGETTDGFGFIVRDFVNECGHQSVTVPGIVAVLAQAHTQLGRLPWAELFGPAIELAEAGWIVRPHNYTVFTQDERRYGRMNYGEKLSVTADGRRIYLHPDSSYRRIGETIRNPDLAATLRTLAQDGPDSFYRGALARRIADDMARHGGLLTEADLAGFEPEVQEPIRVGYRGYELATNRPPGGGVMVAEMLRILEQFDLVALGHNTPEYIRVVAEAMKIATRDKDAHISDPRFVAPPLDRLLSEPYAQSCAAAIRRGEKASVPRLQAPKGDPKETTHVSCVDADKLVVSLTHSLGIPSGVIPAATGFILNGCMSVFDPRPGRAGSIAPGKRRFASMCPSIVSKDGQPVMTLGAPGGTWITLGVLQVILNVLDWGMGMQEAISAPRFVATSNVIDISNRIPRSVQRAVEAMGYPIKRSALSYAFSGVHGIALFDGKLDGGADPQRDGMVASLD